MAERTRIRSFPERAVPDEAADILVAGVVAHVGFVQEGQPFVIPLSYHYDRAMPDTLYLHGSAKGRALNQVANGEPICITVTLVDGYVYSRKAFNHSMNYRSTIVFGRGRAIEDEAEKSGVFEQMVQRYFPGREVGRDYNAPSSVDLALTSLVEVKIEDRSAKARRGGPTGPDDSKPDALGTAGVIDVR